MARRSYDQYCGLAHALDVVGERWTLLLVRELMSGPKRYSDLEAALGGIGTSLLANRIKQLQADGVVGRRLLDPPVNAVAYELTTAGRELGRAVVPLALWGARHFLTEEQAAQEEFRAEWALVFFADSLEPAALRGLAVDYDFHIADSIARMHIADGRAEIISGTNESAPDAVLRSDAVTVGAIVGGRLTVLDAVAQGRIGLEGDPGALETLLTLLQTQIESLVGQGDTP
ncbi:winged helix-turn-helix transcriptional regulator [Nocardia macrotermitis]|uniref:HTH hxlR-type domain-containing protein n=1 Tax=Nocardia macrotermitis TaxID=2585198 RepID=A0A7K0D9D6_9NOCA|nr:helix-turn-helix domain-containing protein [Nocardia macrotermitis]MQY22318.1 hypothetical protein [Nocardia macrotermitis]